MNQTGQIAGDTGRRSAGVVIPLFSCPSTESWGIGEIADLAGHKVGIIGKTDANVAVLRTILEGSGVQPDKVATAQFGTDEIEKLSQDTTLDSPGRPLLPDDQRSVISALVHAFRARNFLAYANVQTRP